MKTHLLRRINKSAIVAALLVGLTSSAAFAVNKHLLQGIQDYHDGDFNAAAGNLGAAMSTEFNNPTLHYYMGNCCVHLKQMESAVREFRIAYALDPTGQVGKFAKQALDYLDVDARGQGLAKKAAPVTPRMDPAMERALATLDKQSSQNSAGSRYRGRETSSQQPWWMQQKKGNDIPPELSKYLDSLRQQYEQNQPGSTPRYRAPNEMQRSADNLKTLLQEKPNGKHHLSPIGTNLYTRNYTQPTTSEKEQQVKQKTP